MKELRVVAELPDDAVVAPVVPAIRALLASMGAYSTSVTESTMVDPKSSLPPFQWDSRGQIRPMPEQPPGGPVKP